MGACLYSYILPKFSKNRSSSYEDVLEHNSSVNQEGTNSVHTRNDEEWGRVRDSRDRERMPLSSSEVSRRRRPMPPALRINKERKRKQTNANITRPQRWGAQHVTTHLLMGKFTGKKASTKRGFYKGYKMN